MFALTFGSILVIAICKNVVALGAESLIFSEDFSKGLDFSVWKHEITMGGGGNWEFEYYASS